MALNKITMEKVFDYDTMKNCVLFTFEGDGKVSKAFTDDKTNAKRILLQWVEEFLDNDRN